VRDPYRRAAKNMAAGASKGYLREQATGGRRRTRREYEARRKSDSGRLVSLTPGASNLEHICVLYLGGDYSSGRL